MNESVSMKTRQENAEISRQTSHSTWRIFWTGTNLLSSSVGYLSGIFISHLLVDSQISEIFCLSLIKSSSLGCNRKLRKSYPIPELRVNRILKMKYPWGHGHMIDAKICTSSETWSTSGICLLSSPLVSQNVSYSYLHLSSLTSLYYCSSFPLLVFLILGSLSQ